MEKSDVFFTDFRTQIGVSQCTKLQKLIRAAGIEKIDFDHKFVAIKMHFGELGNCAYLRPNYVKAVADVVKELGGVTPTDFGALAELAVRDACMADNLYTPDKEEVIGVYENAWSGK